MCSTDENLYAESRGGLTKTEQGRRMTRALRIRCQNTLSRRLFPVRGRFLSSEVLFPKCQSLGLKRTLENCTTSKKLANVALFLLSHAEFFFALPCHSVPFHSISFHSIPFHFHITLYFAPESPVSLLLNEKTIACFLSNMVRITMELYI